VAIVEVRNSNGITEQLGWQPGDFERQGESGEIGVSWVPVNSGNYQLRVFAISSFEHPAVLSPVATSDVTVEENPSKAVVAIIPYDGEPSIHNAMFEPSVLTIVMGVNNTIVWTNGDNVSHRFVGETSFSDPSDFDGKRVFLYPGYSYEHVFTRAGLYQYADPDREGMHGIIWVIPRDALDAHLDIRISGLNDSYSLDEPIGFSADVRGFETGCGSFTITIERIDGDREDNPLDWSSGSAFFDCFDVAAPYRNIDLHFPPPEFESDYHPPIDRAGTYRLTATFEADYTSAVYSATREFLVN
jgi:plastocyanin